MESWFTVQYLFLLLCAALATQLVLYAWQRRPTAGSVWFAVMTLGVAVWALAYALEMSSVSLNSKLSWYYVKFGGLAVVPLAWLFFALEFTGRWHWLKRPYRIALAIPLLITGFLSLSNETHHLLWLNVEMPEVYGRLQVNFGPWLVGYILLTFLYLLLGALLLVQHWQEQRTAIFRWQVLGLLLGVLLPGLANLVFMTGLLPVDLTPLSFVLVGLLLLRFAFRLRLFDITPIAHRLLVDSMEDGVLVLNKQNQVVGLNSAAAKILQQPTDQVIGRQAEAAWPELGARLNGMAESLVEIGPIGASQAYYELSTSPVYDSRQEYLGRLLLVRDITARKERELLQQDMTRSLVHDLRAPISNSLFALEMLKTAVTGYVSPDDQALLDITYANTDKTLQLVNQILDVHRLESGKIPLSLSHVPLAELVAAVIAAQHSRLAQKEVEIVQDIPADLPPAWADADLLGRVLQNLLDNAIKYSPVGGAIHISARLAQTEPPDRNKRRLQVAIADAGQGISAELQERIFDKYVTGEDGVSGSGLGLPFCRMALAAHGEEIWVKSQPGGGTVFTFSLTAPAF